MMSIALAHARSTSIEPTAIRRMMARFIRSVFLTDIIQQRWPCSSAVRRAIGWLPAGSRMRIQ